MDNIVTFLGAAFALTGSPGPNTLSIAAAGAAFGARRSLGYMVGLLAGMIVVMSAVAAGLTSLVLAIPSMLQVLALLAAVYFLYLAWKIATAPPIDEEAATGRAPTFPGGVFLSLVNPKAYAAMGALFSGFTLAVADPATDAFFKIAVLTLVIAAVNLAWLFVGATLTRLFRDPLANRIVNIIFAALLLLSLLPALIR
ncbi:LysE family translocator [Neorhizobium petrolearium]|uniref:LysE family translocator n=1 Tax=Neorhizobium petrolearium TaxID=515361 RepID=UPI003F7E3EC9